MFVYIVIIRCMTISCRFAELTEELDEDGVQQLFMGVYRVIKSDDAWLTKSKLATFAKV